VKVNLPARAAAAEARRAQTRARLLDAAIQVIAEKGSEAASVEDFVVAAGVARGTFYNYFPTIDDLIQALQVRLDQARAETVKAIAALAPPPPLHLAITIHYLVARSCKIPALGWVGLRLAATKTPRMPILEEHFDAFFREGVANGDFRDCNLDAARVLVFGATRMAIRDMLADEAPADHAHQVVALLLIAFGLTPDEAGRVSREAERMQSQIGRAG
jgi:AcrR family transcriptional regulator